MAVEINRVTLEIFSKLEKKWVAHCEGSRKTRVLSIDGGGTSGIVAGASLIYLEDQIQSKTGDSNARIIDFFDIIAGTGIGSLLAVMINADDGNGRPMFTAREAVRFLSDKRRELFSVKTVGVFRRRRMFPGKSMDKVLKEVLIREDGKLLTLKDTCKPLHLTSKWRPFGRCSVDATAILGFFMTIVLSFFAYDCSAISNVAVWLLYCLKFGRFYTHDSHFHRFSPPAMLKTPSIT